MHCADPQVPALMWSFTELEQLSICAYLQLLSTLNLDIT